MIEEFGQSGKDWGVTMVTMQHLISEMTPKIVMIFGEAIA